MVEKVVPSARAVGYNRDLMGLAVATHGTASLSPVESTELRRLERVIDRGRKTFIDVSLALLRIQNGKLYRATHATFADYCRERWGFERGYGYRLAAAGRVIRRCQVKGIAPPRNESQARLMLGNGHRQANGAPRPRKEPRRDEGECHESADGKLIVVRVFQIQRIRENPAGQLVPERVSDWPTEQAAEQEIRRMIFGAEAVGALDSD